MKTYAIIVAAGSSKRFNSVVPKQFTQVCSRPLLAWAVSRFEAAERVDQIVVVVSEEHLLYTSEQVIDPFDFPKVIKIVIGGQTRRESVLKGLEALPISAEYVAIHDGARPLVSPADIDRAVEVAITERATMLAARAKDTVKRAREGYVLSTLERDSLYLAQTPQVFQYDLIMAAHKEAANNKGADRFTDDAAMIEARGFKVKIIEPSRPNLKVTTQDDLILVEAMLTKERDEESQSGSRI